MIGMPLYVNMIEDGLLEESCKSAIIECITISTSYTAIGSDEVEGRESLSGEYTEKLFIPSTHSGPPPESTINHFVTTVCTALKKRFTVNMLCRAVILFRVRRLDHDALCVAYRLYSE